MAGKRGRPSKLEQDIRQLVIDRCWVQLHNSLLSSKTKPYAKDKIAVQIASKCIPQEIKNQHEGQVTIVQMGRVIKNGKPLDFKVGNAIGS
jgi:hypothetical protein